MTPPRPAPTDRVVCLHEGRDVLGEGPLWHDGRLYWVDILDRRVQAVDPDGGHHQSWPMPDRIGFIVPTTRGDFIAGMKHGLVRVELDGGRITELGTPEPELPHNRFNDGKCD